uniref:Uncharacterized protein n=1 Tax=Rhizophora mucronata TaxID=61149 RepID=A0A2P2NY87_RHIMU
MSVYKIKCLPFRVLTVAIVLKASRTSEPDAVLSHIKDTGKAKMCSGAGLLLPWISCRN